MRDTMAATSSNTRLVYSTDTGRICPDCGQPRTACVCKQRVVLPAGDGVVRVQRETKGRGGKAVTVVRGVALPPDALAALGKRLRTACGSGGTAKDGVLEIQGDHVDRVMALLAADGHQVKRVGG